MILHARYSHTVFFFFGIFIRVFRPYLMKFALLEVGSTPLSLLLVAIVVVVVFAV